MAIGVSESSGPGAVISYRFWQARFGGEANALGQTLEVNDRAYSIVGVAPSRFFGIQLEVSPDIWLWTPSRPPRSGAIAGRLRPNVGIGQAQAAIETLLSDLNRRRLPDTPIQTRVTPASKGLLHFGSNLREQYERPLLALMVLVILVLLITCVNVGTLMVVRNSTRTRELTIRVALGARRFRLITQLLVESSILTAAGGAFAVFIADWGVRTILAMLPSSPIALQFQLDRRILTFVAGVSLLSTLLFALAPAWRATQVNLTSGLKAGHPGTTTTRDTRKLGKLLLAGQVGLSVVLLVGAGLFLQTLRNLGHAEPGFDSDGLLQVLIDTRGSGYGPGQVGNLYRSLIERITAIPGVRSASGTLNPIMEGATTGGDYESFEVGSGFFETLRLPLLRGRAFTPEDAARVVRIPRGSSFVELPGVVVISESVAKKFFLEGDAIGRPLPEPYPQRPEIIGVVRDAKLEGLHENSRPQTYFPLKLDQLDRFDAIEIRTAGDPSTVGQAVQDAVRRVNPKLLLGVRTMQQEMDKSIMRERMVAAISAFFSTLGLLLACIGLFGVASYAVTQRTNELGIRIALGARGWDVIRESLQDTLLAFFAGLIMGVLTAIAAARFATGMISDLLFGITATDSLNIAAVGLLMVAVAIAACAIPARRASRVDPLVAIRYE